MDLEKLHTVEETTLSGKAREGMGLVGTFSRRDHYLELIYQYTGIGSVVSDVLFHLS